MRVRARDREDYERLSQRQRDAIDVILATDAARADAMWGFLAGQTSLDWLTPR